MNVAGEITTGDPETRVQRVCTDTRQVQPGDLFVALRGDRFDGHAFLGEAVARGASAVMVERDRAPVAPGCPVVEVRHSRRALGYLAAEHRRDFGIPVVAVGGSNGKTTTKELLASVLSQRFVTLASEASFNNDVGVPLTLLKLERAHEAAVVEVGTNHPGELAPLIGMIQPRYGVITSIGREHLEFFGDLDGVAQEEGCLAELLPAAGMLFLAGDTPQADAIARRTSAPVVRAGWAEGNDWRAVEARVDLEGTSFEVRTPRRGFSGGYRLALLGRHQVTNALLAMAVAAELGLAPDEIRRGLAACRPARMRLQLLECAGVRVLDDSYNANADSVRAALRTLSDLPTEGQRIAVLGDMGELGAQCVPAHEEAGRLAAEAGVDSLFALGALAAVMATAARAAGLAKVYEFPSVDAGAGAVAGYARPGDLVLVKASRATRLERVVERFRRAAPRGA